jgi:hypothetical protein
MTKKLWITGNFNNDDEIRIFLLFCSIIRFVNIFTSFGISLKVADILFHGEPVPLRVLFKIKDTFCVFGIGFG